MSVALKLQLLCKACRRSIVGRCYCPVGYADIERENLRRCQVYHLQVSIRHLPTEMQ